MNTAEFARLREIEDERDMGELEMGDFFLYGKSVVAQKQSKSPGQEISYYQVVSKNGNSVEYAPVFDTLEKTVGEEENK